MTPKRFIIEMLNHYEKAFAQDAEKVKTIYRLRDMAFCGMLSENDIIISLSDMIQESKN